MSSTTSDRSGDGPGRADWPHPQASWREDFRKDANELEREIDETRASVYATLEALERKLSPEHLLDLTLGRVREHGGQFAGNLGSSMKENPVPMLLTSIGIAWMMLSGRRDGNGMSPHASGVRETVQNARERLGQSRETAREQLSRARSGVDYLLHEQPLVLGALGIVAGALIGATLPASEEEDRLIGDVRDRALDKVKTASGETYREARRRAESAAERAKERLRNSERTDASSGEASGGRSRDSHSTQTPPL